MHSGHPEWLYTERIGTETGTIRLTVTGEIDMATVDHFESAVLGQLDQPYVRELLVDLGPVPFMDASGIRVLATARRCADFRGVGLRVVNAWGTARLVMEASGLYHLLTAPSRRG
jgi:anti-anti-sigma factor